MSNCTVYIDESGDLGVNRGTQWFVLSAVIVNKEDEAGIRATISRLKARLNLREIHFKNIPSFYKRALIVRELSSEAFTYMNVLVDTNQFDLSKIPTPTIAYNYVCKYLLQRVSWYLRDNNLVADIVLSARGTSRDGELIQYISNKLLPYPSNNIYASVFDKITAKPASSWDMLQLADVCATTMFLTYETHDYGFCLPCFSMALQEHLYKKNNKVDSYGIKFFQQNMKPDIIGLRKKRICAQKERTPGTTTT